MLEFEYIWMFLLIPLPIIIWLILPAYKEKQESIRIPFFEEISSATGIKPSQGAVINKLNLFQKLLAPIIWVLLVVAIAKPQWVDDPIVKIESARDLLLAVDISQSMDARDYRDTTEGGPGSGPQKGGKKFSSSEIKKAYGILNDPRYKQGNYTGAAKAINKLAPGLADHPDVKNAMKRANENLDLPATGDTTTSNASQEVEQVEEESTDEMFSTRSLGLKGASKRSRDKAREKDKDSEKSKKKEDLDEAKFTPAQISALQKAYAPLKGKTDYKSATGSKMNFNKLKNKMKSYSVSHLQQLSVADIPMVSDAAKELL